MADGSTGHDASAAASHDASASHMHNDIAHQTHDTSFHDTSNHHGHHDHHGHHRHDDDNVDPPSESTPLLGAGSEAQHNHQNSNWLFGSSSNTSSSKKGVKRRWQSLIALMVLILVAILIMIFAFLAPSIIDQYAQQAVTFEPTSLSIHSFTSTGVKARVQGDFSMDANKVKQQSVRDIGRFGTWIAQKAQSGESEVEVTLPEYDIVLGTAHVPPIVVNLRAGEITHVDFITELQPGEFDGLSRLASDWIEGRLGQLRVLGKADVPIKSGIFSFGTQKVVHELLFANKDIPTIPAYKIQKLNIHEVNRPTGSNLEAQVSLKVENPYPVALTVPPVGFSVLVDNCQPTDPYIIVADALSKEIDVHPKDNVEVNVTGYVRRLPDILTQACPGTNSSPLDLLLGNYIKGKETTVYVKGAQTRYHDTPKWIADILSSINVPVPVPGKSFGHLIKNFSMTDTKFSLPSPIAEPGTPEAQPRISANLKAIIAIPEEMNFNLDVSKIRSNATVYYKKKELGTIDLRQWHAANSTRLAPKKNDGPSLLVESALQDVPLNITNDDVLSDVISAIIWGKTSVMAEIKADVDVGVATPLGDFVVRNIPASGTVPVKRRS